MIVKESVLEERIYKRSDCRTLSKYKQHSKQDENNDHGNHPPEFFLP